MLHDCALSLWQVQLQLQQGSCAATWSHKRVLCTNCLELPSTRQDHLHLPASSLTLPAKQYQQYDTSHVFSYHLRTEWSLGKFSRTQRSNNGRCRQNQSFHWWYWCKMWILRNFARKPGVLFSAASMATREFTCWCIHILQISNMLIRSCPAVSCYLSACFFWSFSSSPAPQLDETLEWWCKETPSFAYAEEKHDPFGAVFTSPGWSFQLSELLELLELFLGNQMLICMRMKHTCLHETRWSLFKNKRLKIRFTNTRYDVPKRSALAHGMQCHPFRIWHIVKYIYTTLEATYMKRMQCHAASTI